MADRLEIFRPLPSLPENFGHKECVLTLCYWDSVRLRQRHAKGLRVWSLVLPIASGIEGSVVIACFKI